LNIPYSIWYLTILYPDGYDSKESSTQNERTNQNAKIPYIVAIKVKVYFYKLSLLKSRGSFDL
jgi:hypothetical protein